MVAKVSSSVWRSVVVAGRGRAASQRLLHRDRTTPRPGAGRPETEVLALPTTGQGHAYDSGEAARVLAWRAALERLGMDESAVMHKTYWGTGRANATHGEPLT
jgi:NADPH-dependent ferric siderophore reductase